MGRDRRIRKPSEFQAVVRQGKSWANNLVVLRAHANGMEIARVGISVGRRVGTAVARNRVKRILRELVRHRCLKDGWDIVLIARGPAADADFHRLDGAVDNLLSRAGLVLAPADSRKEV